MGELPLTNSFYGRPRLKQPSIRLVNAFQETSAGGPEKEIRTTRPGLTEAFTVGQGPIFRGYQIPGLYNGDPLFVSGGQLYRKSTLLGSVAYTQFPRFASAQGKTAITSGGGLYVYDGTTLTQIQFFDDGVSRLPSFGGVVVLYNIFIYWVQNSQTFYWSSVGDPTTINAANFSNAQVASDNIVEAAVLGEEVYFFKGSTVEIWDFTGALTAPFAESQGRTYARGCVCQNSPVQADNALFWVADDFTVQRTGTVPEEVSTPLISDRLREAGLAGLAQLTGLSIKTEGHEFVTYNLPTLNETWAYDCATKLWAQWGTQDGVNAEPGVYVGATAFGRGDATYVGSRSSNKVYTADVSNSTDDGVPIRVVVAGAVWMTAGVGRCNNVSLHCVRGQGNAAAPNPQVAMRYSDDGGRTFSGWRYGQTLGKAGAHKFKAVWRYLGKVQQPGRSFEFALADDVGFTVQGATYNEARI